MNSPFFSIIVPTRNRPAVLRRALDSVLAQSCADFEVIVVDDGSGAEQSEAIRVLISGLDQRFRLVRRERDESRHGPHVARNAGIAQARGAYVGFLDDDDHWCDNEHLREAMRCLSVNPEVDVFLANQVARRGETIVVPTWLPFVARSVSGHKPVAGSDSFEITRRDLLQPEGIGFPHVNTALVRREILGEGLGFWEDAAYEEDLDFFLRLIDRAERFVYRAATVSVNVLRDSGQGSGVSSMPGESRSLFRILVCQHAMLHCARAEVRQYVRLLQGGALKTLAKSCYREGSVRRASDLAAQAAAVDPSLRWFLIAVLLRLRAALAAFFSPRDAA